MLASQMTQIAEPSQIMNADRIRLSHAITEQALSAGFDKVGIVRAEALDGERERLREWLARGYQGEMEWM
ncbi:MAG: hypothetical protein H0V18_10470, partial [Pyrinomonadaceae bacterium]|nr:hypothetical protein [Pyrinomonadaceae bacterium]